MERLRFFIGLIFFGCVLNYGEAAVDSSCNSQWQAYNRCMKNTMSTRKDPVTGLLRPYNSISTNMQTSNIRACFKENNCTDPIVPEANSRARAICFPKAFNAMRDELTTCAKKTLSNFQLPDDEYSLATAPATSTTPAAGQTDMLYLLTVKSLNYVGRYCASNVNAQTIMSCAAKKWTTSGLTTPSPRNDGYCDTVRSCKSVSFSSDKCFQGWNDLLCPCVATLRFSGVVTKYENQYISCMNGTGVTVDRSNDPALGFFDASLKGWCDSESQIRSTTSWAPGNRYCDGTATTAKVTTAKVTTTAATTTVATTVEQPEEDTTLPPFVWPWDETTPATSQENPSPGGDDEETLPPFNWGTVEPDIVNTETTTTVAPWTTPKSSLPQWMQDLGINNIFGFGQG